MSNSTNLSLPYLASGQAQKHVTVNESLLRLDALVQLAVISMTTIAEPASPADGAIYILPSGKTGAHWTTMANYALAYYRDGAWEEIAPREGFIAYVKDVDAALAFDGASWVRVSPVCAEGAYTPTFTLETPGDLSVAYTQQAGVYRRVGNLMIVDGRVSFTPTYTTTTGVARFGGLPAPASFGGASGLASRGVFQIGGATTWPSGATQLLSLSADGQSYIVAQAAGSGFNAQLSHSFFTSGTARTVNYSIAYPI